MSANTQLSTVSEAPRRSLLIDMATRYGMEPKAFADTLRATVVPRDTTNEEFAAFLMVAKEYELNPLLKEIFAFPKRGGGIQPIVSIDGWCNLINSHPKLDGLEFDDHLDKDGKVTAITARIWRKDREKPIIVTEYMVECTRGTDTWKQYPRRMLRHKALIQCARYAFGFAGIVDPDEAERMGADVSITREIYGNGPPSPSTVKNGGEPADVVVTEDENPAAQQETTQEQPQPTMITMDERDWLNELSGAFSGCEDLQHFTDTQKKIMAPSRGKVTSEAWARAQHLAEDAYKRVSANG